LKIISQVLIVYNPSYLGDRNLEDHSSRTARAKSLKSIKRESASKPLGQEVRPYLKNNQNKEGWKHDFSCRAPA
jgi:hypothetical protein